MGMLVTKWLIIVVGILVFPAIANACVCPTVGQPVESVRSYYKKDFKGAVFTGKIRSIRVLPPSQKNEFDLPLRELGIEVEQYWLGVDTPVIKVYTLGENTSCTVEWETDRTLFFIASKQKEGLHVGMCDLTNWRGKYPNQEWADYTFEILGPAKSFRKQSSDVRSIVIPRL